MLLNNNNNNKTLPSSYLKPTGSFLPSFPPNPMHLTSTKAAPSSIPLRLEHIRNRQTQQNSLIPALFFHLIHPAPSHNSGRASKKCNSEMSSFINCRGTEEDSSSVYYLAWWSAPKLSNKLPIHYSVDINGVTACRLSPRLPRAMDTDTR